MVSSFAHQRNRVEQLLCARVVLLMPVEVWGAMCVITNVTEMFRALE